MTTVASDDVGRAVIVQGLLAPLRKKLGLSRSTMSELLYVSAHTYRRWEDDPDVRITSRLAVRLGTFYLATVVELELLTEHGIDIADMMPLHQAAVYLALPQEILMSRYRAGEIEARDLGILGLWINRKLPA